MNFNTGITQSHQKSKNGVDHHGMSSKHVVYIYGNNNNKKEWSVYKCYSMNDAKNSVRAMWPIIRGYIFYVYDYEISILDNYI